MPKALPLSEFAKLNLNDSAFTGAPNSIQRPTYQPRPKFLPAASKPKAVSGPKSVGRANPSLGSSVGKLFKTGGYVVTIVAMLSALMIITFAVLTNTGIIDDQSWQTLIRRFG